MYLLIRADCVNLLAAEIETRLVIAAPIVHNVERLVAGFEKIPLLPLKVKSSCVDLASRGIG